MLILVLSLSLVVVGCGSQEKEQQAEQQEQSEQAEEEVAGLDKKEVEGEVTIKLWEKLNSDTIDPTLDKMIKDFEKEYPNIKIERTHMGVEDLRENTQTSYMGGKGPDLVISPFDHAGVFGEMGIAQPLNDLLSDEMKNMYTDNALKGMAVANKMYGLPLNMGNHLTLLYNKNLVDKEPETWEELISQAKELTKDKDGDGKPEQYGLAYNLNEPFWWAPFYTGFGGDFFDENQKPTMNNKAAEQAMKFVHSLKFEHKIVPKECDANLADSLFKKGKAAFIINGDWSFNTYLDNEDIDLGIAPLPKFKESGEYAHPLTSGNGFIMMSELPEEKQVATLKFIKYMSSAEVQKTFVKEHKLLPSNKEVFDMPVIQENEVLKGSAAQLKNGEPMPIISEMRGVWDAIRPVLQSVMADDLEPEKAPEKIQKKAEEKVKGM